MTFFQPHHVSPAKDKVRAAFAFKNFAAKQGISHIGLGISIDNIRRTLEDYGIWCTVWPVLSMADIERFLERDRAHLPHGHPPISHVFISAAWIPAVDIARTAAKFDSVQFCVLSHSNVGFLQADADGVAHIRAYLELEVGAHNFSLAGNSRAFAEWVRRAYHTRCEYLPNLYHLRHVQTRPKPPWSGGTLRIGCFGAVRVQKNLMTAVAAALEIASRMRTSNTEIWLSAGRDDAGGWIRRAIAAMVAGIPGVSLVFNNWQSWPAFRATVGRMDLLISVSYTESFNIVTADGIVEGVPSAVSEAIEWAPHRWKADADDASDIARVGTYLIGDPYAPAEGLDALREYVAGGVERWFEFLRVPSPA